MKEYEAKVNARCLQMTYIGVINYSCDYCLSDAKRLWQP